MDPIEHVIKREGFQIKRWIYTAEDENNFSLTDLPDCNRECETTMQSTAQLISDNEHEQTVHCLQW